MTARLASLKDRILSPSLFVRLLAGFLAVIVLLTTFFLLAFRSMNRSYYQELIGYHTGNLQHTVEKYESSFASVQQLLTNLYLNPQIMRMYSQAEAGPEQVSRLTVPAISETLSSLIVSNPGLFIEDIVLYFQYDALAIVRTGSISSELLFDKYFTVKSNTPDFWKRQFDESYNFSAFPISTMGQNLYASQDRLGIIVKNKLAPHLIVIASLLQDQLMNNMHVSNKGDQFLIYDGDRPVYASSGTFPDFLQAHKKTGLQADGQAKVDFQEPDGRYVFYQKGAKTGLTYYSIIPQLEVEAKLTRLLRGFLTILAIAILFSVIASVTITTTLNSPFKKLMRMLLSNPDETVPVYTKVKELKLINERLLQLSSKNRSMLSIYTFANRLRKIRSSGQADLPSEWLGKPFMLVLFHLQFKSSAEKEKGAAYVRELAESKWAYLPIPAVTLQTESDVIVTIVYVSDYEIIEETVNGIARAADSDVLHYAMTIGVSGAGLHNPDPAAAYEEALAMTHQRRLAEGTQVLTQLAEEPASTRVSLQLEHQYVQQLSAGNQPETLALIRRMLALLEEAGAFDSHYRRLCTDLALRTKQVLRSLHVQEEPLTELERRFGDPDTLSLLQDGLERYAAAAIQLLEAGKSGVDPKIEFIVHYMREHFAEDISLDRMADKVKITPTYLSSYFKEKMGLNFKEYLNDIRMQHAKRYLLETDWKIQDVAERVGYRSLTPFTRMFKLATGMTPNEFRRQL
ncbi:MAG: helix-turn-helix transcriptional regulator [Paenibacillaceae bacterium]|nr:helix-turn-helix transcriptional regulator [Paenibacillaceae bacterium]